MAWHSWSFSKSRRAETTLQILGDDLWRPIVTAFLSEWPMLQDAQKFREQTLRKFYYAHRCRPLERSACFALSGSFSSILKFTQRRSVPEQTPTNMPMTRELPVSLGTDIQR